MILGRVIGNLVATVKDESLIGSKLMLVQILDKHQQPIGRPAAAIDVVHAGTGDLVFMVRARDACYATYPLTPPVDLAIVGVIDVLDIAARDNLELPAGASYWA